MRNLKLGLLAILTTGFFMTMSCKKGDTGPKGPAGPDSVMYSKWTAITMHIEYDQSSGDSVYVGSVTAPQITAKVMNTSSIVGYLLLNDPLTGDSSAINATNFVQEYFTPGFVDLVSTYGYGDLTGIFYRYVIIPAKVSVTDVNGKVQTYSGDQMSKMDYTTLTGLLKIPAKGSGSAQFTTTP